MQESLPVVDDSFSSWKLGGERWEKIERNELWILKLRRVGGRKKICGEKRTRNILSIIVNNNLLSQLFVTI